MNNKLIGFAVVVVLILTAVIPICGGLMPEYSVGTRTGQVTKLSNKGMIIKSQEGEMLLGGMTRNSEGNPVANIWHFSVQDPSLVRQLESIIEKGQSTTMTLTYRQYLIKPISIDTQYVVTSIKEI